MTYYEILSVSENVSIDEIKSAYRKKVLEYHPDVNKSLNGHAIFLQIQEAYRILSDTTTKFQYDNILKSKSSYNQSNHENSTNKQYQQKTEVKTESCYYCSRNIAHKQFSYKKSFYKETNRSYFPNRKVWYKSIEVSIPRCGQCYKIHTSGARIFFFLPLISIAILGLILGLTVWGMWFLCLIAGTCGILSSIDNAIIAKEAGIKKESNIYDFETVVILRREGWSTDKPSA